jgi:hypothetical protein
MKKNFLLMIIAFSFFSCSDNLETKVKIKSILEENFELNETPYGFEKGEKTIANGFDTYSEYDEQGNLTLKRQLNPSGSNAAVYIYEYDKNNLLIKTICYTATENIDKVFSYTYNKSKLLETQTVQTALGSIEGYDKYYYDNKLLKKLETYNAAGEMLYFWEYEYDQNSNKTLSTWFVNGVAVQTYYEYNDKNQLIEQVEINESDITTIWNYTYNEQGDVTQEIQMFFDSSQVVSNYVYEYDEKGNWISKQVSQDDEPMYFIERIIKYY